MHWSSAKREAREVVTRYRLVKSHNGRYRLSGAVPLKKTSADYQKRTTTAKAPIALMLDVGWLLAPCGWDLGLGTTKRVKNQSGGGPTPSRQLVCQKPAGPGAERGRGETLGDWRQLGPNAMAGQDERGTPLEEAAHRDQLKRRVVWRG